MHQPVIALFARKLSAALRVTDDHALAEARALWEDVGPGPSCPSVSDLMRNIRHALNSGHLARDRAATELAAETATSCQSLLSPPLINDLMLVVEKSFPKDHFVQTARNTKGVYQRRQAPTNKFSEHSFEHGLSLIEVGAINSATQTIARIRLILEDANLRQQIRSSQAQPNSQERIVSQINFNAPVSGQVTVAGESINTTVLSLSINEIIAKIDASAAAPAEKEAAKSRLKEFLGHPLVTAVLGGIAGGIGG